MPESIAYNMDAKKTNYIQSYKDGKTKRKHRIIMEEHIGRELNDDEIVHHIDGNKRNNDLSNLQIMSRSEHAKVHAKKLDRCRPILQLSDNGTVIKMWSSAREAYRNTGISYSNICHCCRGRLKEAGGYMWEYCDGGRHGE